LIVARRRLTVFHYRQVIVCLQAGESAREISQKKLASRNKVKDIREKAKAAGWLDPAIVLPSDEELAAVLGPFTPVVPIQTSTVEPHREKVKKWVEKGLQATSILDKLQRECQFDGSYGAVLRFVQRIRNSTPEAFVPLHFEPGEAAQVDFGTGPVLVHPQTGKETRTHLFVMTLASSRHMYAEIVWDQKVATWLRCHRNAFNFFGGLPSKVIIDNLKSAITRACFKDVEVQRSYEAFAEAYGFQISPCRPRTPRHKGRVESGVKYVQRSFVAGREFRNMLDSNTQLLDWVLGPAGNRVHGTTHQIPLRVFAEVEKAALKALPAVEPEMITWQRVTLAPNCHVSFEKAYYSAPYSYVHQRLWVRAGDRLVTIFLETPHGEKQVALHVRATRLGEYRTNDDHLPPEKVAWLQKRPQWCMQQAEKVGPNCAEFMRRLLGDKVVDRLAGAHGVVRLGERYGPARLEAACHRALAYENVAHRTLKTILEKGLDQAPLEEEAGGQLSFGFIEAPRYGRKLGQMLSQ
jgi:transposase